MKNIKTKSVNIPWYLRWLTVYSYNTGELTIGIFPVVKAGVRHAWYWFPDWLHHYQMRKCETYFPDYVAIGNIEATGNKVTPFLGYVIRTKQGEIVQWNWWKYIEKY